MALYWQIPHDEEISTDDIGASVEPGQLINTAIGELLQTFRPLCKSVEELMRLLTFVGPFSFKICRCQVGMPIM